MHCYNNTLFILFCVYYETITTTTTITTINISYLYIYKNIEKCSFNINIQVSVIQF